MPQYQNLKQLASRLILALLLLSPLNHMYAQQENAEPWPVYAIYNAEGQPVAQQDFMQALQQAQVILMGENHNDPVGHWLEYKVLESLYQHHGKSLMLGMEMFETDNQLLLDEYLQGTITERNFETEARLWNNYKTDYKPLVAFAKENGLKVWGTNVPRRYASLTSKKGVEALLTLSDQALAYLPPLPFEVNYEAPGYSEMMQMDMGHGGQMKAQNFVQAQALKDYTMAHTIQAALTTNPNSALLHINGEFHSKQFAGIALYLKAMQPAPNLLTISMVQGNPTVFNNDWQGRANYIIVVTNQMTTTY